MRHDGTSGEGRDARRAARLCLDAGAAGSPADRAYDAMFQLTLTALGKATSVDATSLRSHRAVLTAQSRDLIRPGLVGLEHGAAIREVEALRHLADRSELPIDQVAADRAARLVEVCVAAIDQRLATHE